MLGARRVLESLACRISLNTDSAIHSVLMAVPERIEGARSCCLGFIGARAMKKKEGLGLEFVQEQVAQN